MVSLNDINKEADDKYGPLVIEDVDGGDVVLRNLIRCTENEMAQVVQLESRLREAKKSSNIAEALSCAKEMLELVGVGHDGKRLIGALDGDSAKVMHVLSLWAGATQVGEALRSGNSSEDTATP